jgi:hypothetical protein
MFIIAVTSIHWYRTYVTGMVILLCVLGADTFMCLLFDSIEFFTLCFAASNEGKWHYFQDVSSPWIISGFLLYIGCAGLKKNVG